MTVVAGESIDVQFRENTEELLQSDTLMEVTDGVPIYSVYMIFHFFTSILCRLTGIEVYSNVQIFDLATLIRNCTCVHPLMSH